MKKYLDINRDVNVAFLQIRLIPVQYGLPSPAIILFNRPIRGILSKLNRDQCYAILMMTIMQPLNKGNSMLRLIFIQIYHDTNKVNCSGTKRKCWSLETWNSSGVWHWRTQQLIIQNWHDKDWLHQNQDSMPLQANTNFHRAVLT